GADAALTAAEVLLYPHRGVVGGRLHRAVQRSDLPPGDGVQDAYGLATGEAPGQFRRAIDGRCGRGARIAVIELRGPPDSPRVEQALAGAAVVYRAAVHVEPKDPRPLHEEGTPLLKERLERGQVEDRRIRFDLSKI